MNRLLYALRIYSVYGKYILPIVGILIFLLNILVEQQKARDWFNKINSVPSERHFKVGESDGTYTQIKVEKGKKSDAAPQGVKTSTNTSISVVARVKKARMPVSLIRTEDVLIETEKYLRQ